MASSTVDLGNASLRSFLNWFLNSRIQSEPTLETRCAAFSHEVGSFNPVLLMGRPRFREGEGPIPTHTVGYPKWNWSPGLKLSASSPKGTLINSPQPLLVAGREGGAEPTPPPGERGFIPPGGERSPGPISGSGGGGRSATRDDVS